MLCAETISAAMLNVVVPTSDMAVVIVGAGAVGLSAIMALKLLEHPPKKIIAVDIVSSRLELARSFGATHGVNSKVRPDLMKILMDITRGRGVDGAIDTTGQPEVIKALIHSAARKGKVVTVGVGDVSATWTSSHSPLLSGPFLTQKKQKFSSQQKRLTICSKWSMLDAVTLAAIKETAIHKNFFRTC
jgi:Zn-dependent alcohol dehydrogenase